MKLLKLVGSDYTEYRQNQDQAQYRFKKAAWDMTPQGRCRIVGPNGRIVAVVNGDPGDAPGATATAPGGFVSDEVMAIEMDTMKRLKNSGHMQQAPHPKNCKCRAWPGKIDETTDNKGWPKNHHEQCPFLTVYARQRGGVVRHVQPNAALEPTIHHGGAPANNSSPKPTLLGRHAETQQLKKSADNVPGPKNCPKCKDFTKSRGMATDQHHPGCIYYSKYLAISKAQALTGVSPTLTKKNTPYLYDLKTQRAVRLAEPDEIAEARARLRDESAALCKVGAAQYLVMMLDGSQLEPAPPPPPEEEAHQEIETTASDTEPPPAYDVDRAVEEAAATVE